MKTETLRIYFRKILEATNGDNTSDKGIIDYKNGTSISIDEIEKAYYEYLELQERISDYIEENDLSDTSDREKIMKHFSDVDEDYFLFDQGLLKDFVDYMVVKVSKL